MTARRGPVAAAALLCAAAVAGCGLGPGSSSEGTATLTVTRDYGTRTLVDVTDSDPPGSETVIRLLDREAEIGTRYGGGFVQSINGLSGTETGGRRYDWFFYVNGIESPVGAADVRVHGGDRIWWDYRDWSHAMRVPAVVGSWPEPFAQSAAGGDRMPVRVECRAGGKACDTAADRLADAGVHAGVDRGEPRQARAARTLRLLVGPWSKVRADGAVDELRGGPARTGVFATFEGPVDGSYRLIALDPTASSGTDLGPGTGLVAALRDGDGPPTWIVTGSDASAVRRAASLLVAGALRNRYAVAAPARSRPVALPLAEGDG